MASHQRELTGSVDDLVAHLETEIVRTSATGKFEDGSDTTLDGARMVVRVYERFSAAGSSRVSLSFSILAVGDRMAVTAVTSGGSQAMFFKINTWGEETFLEKAVQALDSFNDRGASTAFL